MPETTEADLGCTLCGTYEPCTPCERCGALVHQGMFPLCRGNPDDHGNPGERNTPGGLGFVAFDDEQMPDENDRPVHTTSLADWNRRMKENGWVPNQKKRRSSVRRTILRTKNGKLIAVP